VASQSPTPTSQGIPNGSGNGVQKRLTGTAKRQRKSGNGMVETRHYLRGGRSAGGQAAQAPTAHYSQMVPL